MEISTMSMNSIWHNRRAQRLLGFAMGVPILLLLLLSSSFWLPTIRTLKTDTLSKFHTSCLATSPPTTSLIDPTRVALILETRPIPHLPALLSHFISVLPSPWLIRFAGSHGAIAFLLSSNALKQHVASGKLLLTPLPEKYVISNAETISATLTDLSFYKEFLSPAEWLLVFQSDSMICSASERSIEDWVAQNWTYIGAPWNLGNPWGGNGGLSLRHVPTFIKLLENVTRQPETEWEDVWLSNHLGEMDPKHMPSPEIERYFSVESVWTERPFGYHLRGSGKLLDAEIWGNKTRREQILWYCPEIKIVLDMDLK